MSEGGDNIIGVRTVYDAVLRLEGKLDEQAARFRQELETHREAVDGEVGALRRAIDVVVSEQSYQRGKVDGSLFMVKWLGPTGIAALVLGGLVMAGIVPLN